MYSKVSLVTPSAKCVFFGVLLGLPLCSSAADFDISGRVGYDSNPLKLSETFGSVSQPFFRGHFEISDDYQKQWKWGIKVDNANYPQNNEADWQKMAGNLGFNSKFKFYGEKFRYKLSADHKTDDRTFVSRFTGQVGKFSGVDLGDRYDTNVSHINAALVYRTNTKKRFEFYYQARNKNYQSYDVVGLSKLDYVHHRLGLDMRFPLSETSKIKLIPEFTFRDYKDRRIKDVNGNSLVDTDLQFQYLNFEGSYSSGSLGDLLWKVSAKYSQRTDNGEGYWDSATTSLSLYARYVLIEDHIFSSSIGYRQLSYANRVDVADVDVNELLQANNGFTFKFDYKYVFYHAKASKLSLFAKLQVDSFDSSSLAYQYDRNQLSAGIRWDT